MLVLFVVGCSKEDGTNSPLQSALVQKTYTNAVLGVSAKTSAGWTLISAAERESRLGSTEFKDDGLKDFVIAHMSKPFLVMTKPRQASPQPTITVLVAPLESTMSTDPVANLQSMAASGERAFVDYRIVEEPRSTDVGGRKGAYCKATYTMRLQDGETAPVSFETWHTVRGDYYFLIGAVSRQPEDASTENEIKEMLSSFKINEASATRVQAQTGNRMLMHTFEDGSDLVFVAIVDSPAGPQGIVTSRNPARNDRHFTVSQEQFEEMWSILMSGEASKYAGGGNANRSFDTMNFYVFSAGIMPHGTNTNFVIPTNAASPALVALATQFRAFAQ
jgi:hypothetical protein